MPEPLAAEESRPATAPTPQETALPFRQWIRFPSEKPGVPTSASPQLYCLVVESACRRIVVVTTEQRVAPGPEIAGDLAALIDDRALALASRERLAGEFGERHGITVDFADFDLDTERPGDWPAILSRRVAQLSLAASRVAQGAISLSDLRTAAAGELREEWATAIAAFVGKLSVTAVSRARATDGLRPSAYNYLNGSYMPVPPEQTPEAAVRRARRANTAIAVPDDEDAGAAMVGRDRAQALAVFPFLQRLITRKEFEPVRKAIDNGEKLVDALADHFGVSRGMIRTLRGLTSTDLGRWAYQLQIVLKVLRNIPADWWPRDPDAWRRYIVTVDTITRTTRHPITTSSNLFWLHHVAKHGYQLTAVAPEEMIRIGQEIDEFLDALRQALVWTLRRAGVSIKGTSGLKPFEIVSRLKADLSMVKTLELTRRYGDAYRRATLRFAEEAELLKGVRWPALGGGPATYGNIEIVPLLTPEALGEEGIRMSNCAAGYVTNCAAGKCQMWSVRTTDGLRLSTLETRVANGPQAAKGLTIAQHKGYGNVAPPSAAAEAAAMHVKVLMANPSVFREYIDWRTTISGVPLDERQRHALMLPMIEALKEVLPKKWAFDRLLAMVGKTGIDIPTEASK